MKNNNIFNILALYEREISKNVKNKRKVYRFEINKMQNLSNIITMLDMKLVGHNHYNIFLIYEPKVRLVMSLPIKDKIINHFVTRYILEAKLTKYLDSRNVATRKKMGTDYALKLLIKYINILKRQFQKFYVLKIDISKYFYSINHQVLKKLLKDKLTPEEFILIEKIIDSTNNPEINETINLLMTKNKEIDIPIYDYDKGLPIGNMTSQFLSIFYLYKLDHYIVNDLHLKYFVRYMDDFIILSEDKNKLIKAQSIIKNILENEYLVKVNTKKTFITSSNNFFNFLGYNFKVVKDKTIIKIKKSNFTKVKKRVKEVKYLLKRHKISYNSAFSSVMTYSNCYKHSCNQKMIDIVERYFYNEK